MSQIHLFVYYSPFRISNKHALIYKRKNVVCTAQSITCCNCQQKNWFFALYSSINVSIYRHWIQSGLNYLTFTLRRDLCLHSVYKMQHCVIILGYSFVCRLEQFIARSNDNRVSNNFNLSTEEVAVRFLGKRGASLFRRFARLALVTSLDHRLVLFLNKGYRMTYAMRNLWMTYSGSWYTL